MLVVRAAAVPVICSDAVVDTFQIARAKLAGATGITIRYGLNAADKTKELVETTLGLGMEPLMLVRRGGGQGGGGLVGAGSSTGRKTGLCAGGG